jgi:hypothetical protein
MPVAAIVAMNLGLQQSAIIAEQRLAWTVFRYRAVPDMPTAPHVVCKQWPLGGHLRADGVQVAQRLGIGAN